MIQFVILLICVSILATNLHIRVERVLPVVAMCTAICTYSFGLLFNLNCAFYITTVIMIMTVVLSSVCVRKKSNAFDFKTYACTTQIFIFLCVLLIVFYAYSIHSVLDWDDLVAWGIYAKTLFSLDKLPSGIENCSINYKDYQPIQQIMQYFFMKGAKSFDESRLFIINAGFMYAICMPLLESIKFDFIRNKSLAVRTKLVDTVKNGLIIAIYLLFPHMFTIQFYYRLGVDYLISMLFGYTLYLIHRVTCERGLENRLLQTSLRFDYIALITSMSYLSLIKSSGIVLTLLLIVVYSVATWKTGFEAYVKKDGNGKTEKNDKNDNVSEQTTSVKKDSSKLKSLVLWGINVISVTWLPIVYYASFKVFAHRNGNYGYLSDRVDANVSSRVIVFPSYTADVLKLYLKSIFTSVLTRQSWGMTVFIALIIITVSFVLCRRRIALRMMVAMVICFVAFCVGHIYMYLFVFDEWEALGLLEFDRYICQYLAGALLYSVIILLIEKKESITVLLGLAVLFLVMFPYKAAGMYLGPKNYNRTMSEIAYPYVEAGKKEFELSGISEKNIPVDEKNRILIIADAFDFATHYFVYESVPHAISYYANVPAIEAGNLNRFVKGQLTDRNIQYVYVLSNAAESFQGDFNAESSELTSDGAIITQGWYKVDDDKSLRRIQ